MYGLLLLFFIFLIVVTSIRNSIRIIDVVVVVVVVLIITNIITIEVSLYPFKINTMLVACSGYKEWHQAVFGKEDQDKLLPIPEEKLKCYCIALFNTGYTPTTILDIHVNGQCIWVRKC